MTDPKVKGIKVTMDDKEWDLYHKVKEELGLKSDAELFRYLVRYYFRREMRE